MNSFSKYSFLFLSFVYLFIAFQCQSPSSEEPFLLNNRSWAQIKSEAKHQELNLMMWSGDPNINAYMQNYVRQTLQERFDIRLNIIAGQGKEIVKVLLSEQEASKEKSALDVIWINGETFFQLKEIKALYGPFTDKLPNAKLIDFKNPFIAKDFQQAVDGMECPWGNVQMLLIHDTERSPQPPQSMADLEDYLEKHPGTFTLATEFTGITLLKSWLIALANDPQELGGDFDEEKYQKYSAQLWSYINRIKKNFWKSGETFPSTLAQLHQMFANGEIHFTMSNNDAEVDNKIAQGLFPKSARAFPLKSGTIQNSHYLGIVNKAPHKAAALLAINFLISPEAQYEKMKPSVWGDGSVLDQSRLSPKWQEKFSNIPSRQFAPKRSAIQPYALQELAPEYMIRLYDDFRRYVIEK